MMEFKPRPVIFLYTEAAAIKDDVRERMIEAGYLPVLVADINAVKIMTPPVTIDPAELSAVTVAALEAILASSAQGTTTSYNFGLSVATELLAAKKRK